MSYLKAAIFIVAICTALISCNLFSEKKENNKIEKGEVVWSVKNQTTYLVGTQPLIEKNRVYFIQDRKLKAYTLSEGKKLWSTQIVKFISYTREIIGDNNKIYIDQGYDILAINKTNGSLAWHTDVTNDGSEVSGIGGPIMSQDNKFLYAGRNGYVVKLRKSNGQIVRRFELDMLVPEGLIQGSTEPIISPFGDNILYVPASYFDFNCGCRGPLEAAGGNIFAFNASTGELIWKQHVTITVPDDFSDPPADSISGSPRIYDIAVTEKKVVALSGNYVVALNRFTGKPVWKTYLPRGGFDVGLAVKNGSVYAASVSLYAFKLDLKTGKKIWRTYIKYSNTSIPTVKNGRLYFVNSGGGAIWVLDTEDGSVIYYELPPDFKNDHYDVYISSLAVDEGYMVDVGSQAVYCLTIP